MDIMNSKKTLLSLINGGVTLGAAPTGSSTVKFAYTENIAKVGTASDGTVTFYADTTNNTGIIAVGDKIVSSKIFDVTSAAANGNKHGGKTITVTYFNAATKEAATTTFDVIDEAGLEAYFAQSKTITLDTSTFEVKLKNEGGIKVDNANGLYVDINDLFGVDASTIGFNAQNKLKSLLKLQYHEATTGDNAKAAYIALEDVNGNSINEIPVSNIIGNGILKSVSYNKDNNTLILVFQQADGTDRTVTVDMKDLIDINDIFLDTAHDADDYLTLTNDTSIATFGVTDKTKTAVALAETAVQNVVEGTSVEGYVALNVSAKSDASVITITTDDTSLSNKLTEVDTSIGDISTRLANKTAEIDSSIDRLDVSVSAIEAAIEAMDATPSDSVLDGSIAISLTEVNGVITGVDLEATKSTVVYTAKDGNTPANLTGTPGLLMGGDISTIKQYIDETQSSGFDALDSSINVNSTDGSLNFKVVETDGKLTSGEISYTKATVTYTPEDGNTPSSLSSTEGFLMGESISAIKSYIDTTVNRQDSSVGDKDAKEFVEVKTEMTNGALSAQEVNVTYGAFTVTPGSVTASTQGIVDSSAVAAAINNAIKWTIL